MTNRLPHDKLIASAYTVENIGSRIVDLRSIRLYY
jgi:hypothetical protein